MVESEISTVEVQPQEGLRRLAALLTPAAIAPGLLVALTVLNAVLLVQSGGRPSGLLATWAGPAAELGAGILCLVVARAHESGRRPALIFAGAVLTWGATDILSIFKTSGALNYSPWAPVVLHLAFFPLALTGLILFVHPQLRRSDLSDGLDGLIAGLGMAAVCAAFTFPAFSGLPTSAAPASTAHFGLLLGNAVLAALVGGCYGAISGRRGVATKVLGAGLLLVLIQGTSRLFQSVAGASAIGHSLDLAIAPLAFVTIAVALLLRDDPAHHRARELSSEFVLPNLAAAGALAIEFVNIGVGINPMALTLAGFTLLAAGVRLFLLLRATRAISAFRHEQAETDQLTGLWNRRHLFRLLDAYFTRRTAGATDDSLAFLFVDLDRFKEINDSFGHAAGDQLLRLLANRLSGSLRAGDVLVRLGGDEFGVVLPGSDTEGAVTVALRLANCLDHPFQLERVTASIGASIGVAVAPRDAQDSEALLWCADVAMYRAKTERSKLACYEETVDVERDQMRLLQELRTAVEEDELMLHYQPQLDLRTGAVAGVEALLRWRHPRLGLLAPVNFLPLAERTGEITAITRWVLDHAIDQLSVWRSRGLEVTVAVNVSPSSLRDASLLPMVQEILNRHGQPASALVLEITENWVTADFATARDVIGALGALGVTVSIDDFGAGATSLAYLRELSAGELKLDRAFVTGLTDGDGREPELLRSTIELGHAMGLRIVAEGVEDEATLSLLSRLGCDLAQGYHISKPKPPNELALRPKPVRRAA